MAELVCAILVNYNGAEDTRECVKSLLEANYDNIRIIVVDNASTYAKIEYDQILTKDKCDVIYETENLGFAGANNVGIRFAEKYKPQYYLIINNDTVVEKNFLQPLIDECSENPSVGIATGKIYYYDDKHTIWFGGSYYDSNLYECKIDGIGEQNQDRFNEKKQIPFATGCLWLLPAEVVKTVGLMNEDYFLYYEDADYCERVKECGYSIQYVPKSVIYHKESRSTKKGSDAYHYYNIRNYLIFLSRFAKKGKFKAYLSCMIKNLKNVIRKRIKLKVVFAGVFDFTRHKMGQKEFVR